jgi:uncharacterized membrane protein YfcA
MEVFLPIAQVSINAVEILFLSAIVGILSGLFGVGGGFLMTPFLIFLGVPPAYAVANEANNILATSVSGSTTHYLKNTLDYKMGFMIVIGGAIGTLLGIYTFSYFKGIGKIDTVISLAYMYILAIIGTLMLVESLGEIDNSRKNALIKKKTTCSLLDTWSSIKNEISKIKIVRKYFYTNNYWVDGWFYSCDYGYRWSIYFSSSDDLYY